jgi:hypothetical protein
MKRKLSKKQLKEMFDFFNEMNKSFYKEFLILLKKPGN